MSRVSMISDLRLRNNKLHADIWRSKDPVAIRSMRAEIEQNKRRARELEYLQRADEALNRR